MLKPYGDRVVIELVQEAQTTRGGLYLPDSAKEKPVRGKVIAVGQGRTLDNGTKVPVEVKAGDIVIFAQYGGTKIEVDGTEYTVLNERDILAIVE